MPLTSEREEFRYDIARQWMEGVMGEVTSADKAYAYLQERDVDIPRRVVRDVWKETGEAISWRPLIDRLPPHYLIPKRWTVEVKTGLEGPYIAKVRIRGVVKDTVLPYERFPTISFDHQPTTEEINEAAMTTAERYEFDQVLYAPSIANLGTYHVEGAEW